MPQDYFCIGADVPFHQSHDSWLYSTGWNYAHTTPFEMAVCLQDKSASDSMDPAMDMMQLNGLIRKAIHLVTGAQIRVTEDEFEFAVTSVIPGFKVWCCCSMRASLSSCLVCCYLVTRLPARGEGLREGDVFMSLVKGLLHC